MRPQADGPALPRILQQRLPDGTLYHEYRYDVVRVWELPVEESLADGLATLPLAPIARNLERSLFSLHFWLVQRPHQAGLERAPAGHAAGVAPGRARSHG